MAHERDDHPDERAARGDVRTSGSSLPRPTWLLWVDPETGERLRIELTASPRYLSALLAAGFQPAAEDPFAEVDIELLRAARAGDDAA